VKERLLQQDKDIEKYITALRENKDNPVDTIYYHNGVYRIVMTADSSEVTTDVGEPAAAGDSVIFEYGAYLFSSGKGAMYDSGEEHGTLGSGSYLTGLEAGLTGMVAGERAQVVFAGDKGYGNKAVGVVPPNSSLLFEIKMIRVVKN
jgi:FKBP-type peptidyl-prolyl cis-trans isomerase